MTQYDCEIFEDTALRAHWGINEGEYLGPPDSLCSGDIYQLVPGAQARTIVFDITEDDIRTSAGQVTVLAELRWMAQDNELIDAVLLDVAGSIGLLPLSPMRRDAQYALIDINTGQTRLRLSRLVYGCFCTGTRIMSADGMLTPIEALQAGDSVLTRDNGAQSLLWVGKTTTRAVGAFAPVSLPAGFMGNLGPLVVGPLQRIFLYQRGGLTAVGRSEALLQARHLVDGTHVQQREGGFVTYYALVFQEHQIIYAEGVPVESLLVSRATVARLPDEFAHDLSKRFPHLNQRAHFAQDIPDDTVARQVLATRNSR